jgi:hypothetical protein
VSKIKILIVRSVAGGFRRAGIAFSEEAMRLDPAILSKQQIAVLKAEPALSVSEESVEAPEPKTDPKAQR